jgi:hypothetical protein
MGATHIAIIGNDEAARGVLQLKPLLAEAEQAEVRPEDVSGLIASTITY